MEKQFVNRGGISLGKRIFGSITELSSVAFSIENVTMMRTNVIPPASFKCRKGWRKICRFFYVIHGTFTANTANGKRVVVNAGEIAYLPGDVEYESEWMINEKCEYISFECSFFDVERNELVLGEDMYVIAHDKTEKCFKNMVKMFDYFSRNSISSHVKILSYAYRLMADIMEEAMNDQVKIVDALSPIYNGVVHIEDNYRNDIMINDIAKLCNVSESTFRRNFYKQFGVSPHDYIDNLKLQKAKELLETGMYTVKEVGDFLGFYDTSHFNKFFKKYCGVTPSQYNND